MAALSEPSVVGRTWIRVRTDAENVLAEQGVGMSKRRVVILGGGTGGTMAANRLRKHFDADELEIHVVDRDDRHVYQPGLLFVPFGLAQPEKLVRSRRAQLRGGIAFHEGEVESVSLDADEVRLADGDVASL